MELNFGPRLGRLEERSASPQKSFLHVIFAVTLDVLLGLDEVEVVVCSRAFRNWIIGPAHMSAMLRVVLGRSARSREDVFGR